MRLKKDSSEQKLRGAYYTPLQLADAMVELFASQNISTVLEPSCGDGVFLDALQNLNLLNKVDKLTAVEIEPDEAEKVRDRYSEFEQIEVCTEDFFDFYNRVLGKEQYDLILGNPPYIRYELSGAINQVLNYRDKLTKEYYSLCHQSSEPFEVLSPKCVVIIGKMASLTPGQVAAFENFRNSLSNVLILTFDELYQRIVDLIAVLSESPNQQPGIFEPETGNEDLPF